MKKLFVPSILGFIILNSIIFSSAVSFAKMSSSSSGIKYTISPLFGYETVFKATPTPHTLTRMMYGARLTTGIDLISAELEYTKGNDTENFLTAPQKIETTDEKLKLGITSKYHLNDVLFASARLGGQAKKSVHIETTTGFAPVTFNDATTYDPYAGAGVGIHLGPISVSLGAVAVVHSTTDMSQNDIQQTISISVGN
jgi:hypothetical protein